jgi:hypothetical protein
LSTLMHWFWQFSNPVGHAGTHALFAQVTVPPVGAVHALPHAPQFVTDVVVSTHPFPAPQ